MEVVTQQNLVVLRNAANSRRSPQLNCHLESPLAKDCFPPGKVGVFWCDHSYPYPAQVMAQETYS
jgi:hypothetical protein